MKRFIRFKAKQVQFSYGFPIKANNKLIFFTSGNKILVGNSGNESNNHIDIYYKLKDFNLKERKVISPLSYGGSIKYINNVIK